MRKIDRALLSVSDKTGIVDLARALAALGIELISTGGTAQALRDAGLKVVDVSAFTGFPEMLDGRVKTLHPKVHGGILARREDVGHQQAAAQHGIKFIDLVVVNLYPFQQTIAQADTTFAEAIENIDIGGPAMIRSAAKNHKDVAVIVDPGDYQAIIGELEEQSGHLSLDTRQRLAARAFAHTARYDLAIAGYLAKTTDKVSSEFGAIDNGAMPAGFIFNLEMKQPLRYGENPHQPAALYVDAVRGAEGIATARQLQGKELSYNNLLDLDAAWQLICEFEQPACAIIKHTNPCGLAYGASAREAFEKARETDPVSAFGGIIAFNQAVDAQAAQAIADLFAEVIVAPEFHPDALEVFKFKKNLRLITYVDKVEKKIESGAKGSTLTDFEVRKIFGGYLVQGRDTQTVTKSELKVVSKRKPEGREMAALDFAWKICKHVKSNAIVYATDGQLVGVGAGQMSRVDSVKLAAQKARLALTGSVMASDAFFPFRDGIDEAAKHGISAVIQPGGSVRDEEVVAAADEHGLAMVFTGLRHFKH